ncbi:MAG TPA: imidazole glycerol phosphate synthase subunit HisH [Woeseiaceae bacterium]|nr:imidazole glycerol phosphate synthase subunit HisH [Woeseiaceae bacterium]
MNARTVIIDSGGANLSSLLFAMQRLGEPPQLTTDAMEIRAAQRVILPGVGTARDAMQRLRDHNLVDVIRKLTQPVLGVCLGMQLLADASEEDDIDCLGIIPGIAKKLISENAHPVPNMGWCRTRHTQPHEILHGIDDGDFFYYLHSYALPVSEFTVATAQHASDFSAIICRDNFCAAQFHPERSSAAGARLLANFLRVSGI